MNMPKGLADGDTVGIVAPAGPLRRGSYSAIEQALNTMGFSVKFGASCKSRYRGYLSATDQVRADDVNRMFADDGVDGIICMRGGYGTPRLLDLIDYPLIEKHPKVFVGFSDITALHGAINQNSKLVTFHGPMAYNVPAWDQFTKETFISAVNIVDTYDLHNPPGEEILTITEGMGEGKLVGGNLSLITAMMGTDYELDTKDKILFIEEIGEPIYKIDKMLTQLLMAGKLEHCSGIVFGDFHNCQKEHYDDFDLMELIKDRVGALEIPCVCNVKSGHCMPMITLPLGMTCALHANKSDSNKITLST